MTDLNEKLKLVAQYSELPLTKTFRLLNKTEIIPVVYNFHQDYRLQIPVWQKLCNEFLDMENKCTDDIKIYMIQKEKYCKLICYGTPLESFEILVQAIIFINNLKKK